MPRPSPKSRSVARLPKDFSEFTPRGMLRAEDGSFVPKSFYPKQPKPSGSGSGVARGIRSVVDSAKSSFEHAQRNIPPAIERLKSNFQKIKKHTSR